MTTKPIERIAFRVNGKPQSRGSKTPTAIRRRDGSVVTRNNGSPVIVTRDSNKNSTAWMQSVRDAAALAHDGDLLAGPVKLSVVFYFRRPKAHYRTGKYAHLLKDSAPAEHAQKPDLSKCVRAVEDGMTGIVYRDDSQIAAYGDVRKAWTTEAEGAEICVEAVG